MGRDCNGFACAEWQWPLFTQASLLTWVGRSGLGGQLVARDRLNAFFHQGLISIRFRELGVYNGLKKWLIKNMRATARHAIFSSRARGGWFQLPWRRHRGVHVESQQLLLSTNCLKFSPRLSKVEIWAWITQGLSQGNRSWRRDHTSTTTSHVTDFPLIALSHNMRRTKLKVIGEKKTGINLRHIWGPVKRNQRAATLLKHGLSVSAHAYESSPTRVVRGGFFEIIEPLH